MKIEAHPIIVLEVGTYTALVLLSLVRVEILYYAWPYPLLLSVQKWVDPGAWVGTLGGWVVGLAVVLVWARIMPWVLNWSAGPRKAGLIGILVLAVVAWLYLLAPILPLQPLYCVTSMLKLFGLGSLFYMAYSAVFAGWPQVKTLGLLATCVGALSWYVPLAMLQLLSQHIAEAAGWPYGE